MKREYDSVCWMNVRRTGLFVATSTNNSSSHKFRTKKSKRKKQSIVEWATLCPRSPPKDNFHLFHIQYLCLWNGILILITISITLFICVSIEYVLRKVKSNRTPHCEWQSERFHDRNEVYPEINFSIFVRQIIISCATNWRTQNTKTKRILFSLNILASVSASVCPLRLCSVFNVSVPIIACMHKVLVLNPVWFTYVFIIWKEIETRRE